MTVRDFMAHVDAVEAKAMEAGDHYDPVPVLLLAALRLAHHTERADVEAILGETYMRCYEARRMGLHVAPARALN